MTNPNLIGGRLELAVDGEIYDAKGDFTYNLGADKREAVVGSDGVHGFKSSPQAPFIEGAITDRGTLDLAKVLRLGDAGGATATLALANGKTIVLREAWYAGDGNVTTAEGEIQLRLEGVSAQEV